MKILMVASEAIPLVRTSDVASVVTGLSSALHKQGHDIRIAIPYYRTLTLDAPPRPIISEFDVPLGIYTSKACLWRLDHEGVPVYLVDNRFYFGREDPYGYLDDYERFIFFTRAVVEMLRNDEFAAAEQWHPDVIHGHDWIAGFIPWWLRYTYKEFFNARPMSFVYTIHNAGFPGQFGYRAITVAGLEELGIYESIGEQPSRISFLARGILAAHAVNTVSPRHAEEIKHEEYTRDLARALAISHRPLHGILNGLDYVNYNPAFDDIITYKFDRDRTHLRKENKRLLQEECGLIVDADIPLLGFISRLISEKGTGLLEQILPTLLTLNDHDIQVVIVGVAGDYPYLEIFRRMQEEHNKQFVSFITSLDDPLSRKLLGSADLMLIPSLHEPCGLQQMLSMRYGAIPVVRRTGGLADTVASWETTDQPDIGKGFTFDEPDASSFLAAIQAALQMYSNNQETWQEIQRHNMKVEFSWYNAAHLYTNLYKEASQGSQEMFTLEREAPEPIRPNRWDQLIKAILEGEELAITSDQSAYLKRVARTIRELLLADAVLIWKWDERDPQRLRPEGYSFSRNKTSSTEPFNPDLYQSYTEQDSRSWQYVHRLAQENKEAASPLGFLESELARQHGWITQLKVPMRTHGAFLGRIDIFTCDSSRDFTDEDKDLLSAFATSMAANLEKVRLSKETSDLLEAEREIAQGQTVDDIARSILYHAKRLTHSNNGQLRFQIGQEARHYLLNEQNQFSRPIIHPESASILSPATTRNVNDEESGAFSMRRNSQLHVELTNAQGQSIGEMSIVKFKPMALSRNDEAILKSLSLQAATFLQAAYIGEKEDKRRVEQISKLADSLFGGVDFDTLLQKVLATTADVLQAKAASLYLINEETRLLEIRAADGYHKPLLKEKATYQLGEGTTGWIAQQGKSFRVDSLMQLHNETPWKGKHKHLQGDIEPNTFLGIPLKVTDRVNPKRQIVIGVLKLEDRQDNTTFTTQDERLGEMMANVIATVIQNERLSNTRLLDLNANLQKLSGAMVGGLEMPRLVQRIVDTIAEVVGADASSLYLIEPGSNLLKIQAATGYQKGLVREGALYNLEGGGITAWIAREGQSFKANSVAELHQHPHWAGKHNVGQGDKEPNAFLGIPLKVITTGAREEVIGVLKVEEVIGVLKVEDVRHSSGHPEKYFTAQDVILVEMMGNIIATVIQNTRFADTRLRELDANLQKLSGAMVGGLAMPVLVQHIVDTIAEVVGADASSLYLIEPGSNLLKIQAATGYQKGLVRDGASYDVQGPGITAWIAREVQSFKANSKAELHLHPRWKGKHNAKQGDREPNAFLGIPLKVIATGGKDEVIGVLKVEDVRQGPRHPEGYFTEQDQLLVEMMGNVIATVIQNTRFADIRLRELNASLQKLSGAMVGGLEMPVLVQHIVDTIAEVVGADASSLYLIEPGSNLLKIQAATGYQMILVKEHAVYSLQGSGITAWIAREGRSFKANSVVELRKHAQWRGKYVRIQGEREPNAFLGIPLKVITTGAREEVIGVLKVEDVRPGPRHPEAYFTEQDQLLVEMMGNVITTVIQNTHESEMRQNDLKKVIVEYLNNVIRSDNTREGIRSTNLVKEMMAILVDILKPKSALEVLRSFMSSDVPTVVEALSHTLIDSLAMKGQESLETQISALAEQTGVLLNAHPEPELFLSLAKHSKDELVKCWYDTAYELYQSTETEQSKILEALQLELPWQEAKGIDRSTLGESFQYATKRLVSAIAATVGEKAEPLDEIDEVGLWTGFRLPNIIFSPDIRLPQTHLPILFFKSSRMPSQEDIDSLRLLLRSLRGKGIGNIVSVVSFLPKEEAKQLSDALREIMKPLGVDSLFFTLRDIQRLVSAKDPRPLLMGWLLEQVNLLTVSPYIISGPTPSSMFFGREIELQEITQQIITKSYAIIGGRRVGKTSLMMHLHEISLPQAGVPSRYLDCSAVSAYETLLRSMIDLRQLGEETLSGLTITFQQLLQSPPQDKFLVLLLDEADKLIPVDQKNGWPLFSVLRSFINERKGQIVLGGERTLLHALQDPHGLLFNFAEDKLIGPLNRAAVERLVTLPMKHLLITLVNEKAIVDLIWESTGGHPNVVQRLCRRLIDFLNRENTRHIELDNVRLVVEDFSFLIDDFLNTYWEQASDLERIISLLMVKKGAESYSSLDIRALLADYTIPAKEHDVKEALDNLETLRSILKRDLTGYRFAISAFPQVLAHTGIISDLISDYTRKYLETKEEAR